MRVGWQGIFEYGDIDFGGVNVGEVLCCYAMVVLENGELDG